ncbi:MAG: hypothetical protein GX941_10900 [Candidatus Methanofastidiosa archaeon]|jgi:hypothetical protein|nr:hypothetical protein [Candidatus Methanofastidiosa archaeon]HOM95608.1 hypothetical protein [Methanofastidiosum sp.]HPC81298.1 hypothetical protein [Methanofastidiosum sp.]HRS24936.1 hypothetical protein [Methanofastidiosum sp.]
MKFVVSRICKNCLNPDDPPCENAVFDRINSLWIKDFPDLGDLMRFFSKYGDLVITENEKTQMAEIVIYDDWKDIREKLKS